MRPRKISLRCGRCGNAMRVDRQGYEPAEAVETVTTHCDICDDGDFGTERHFARDGSELPFIEPALRPYFPTPR